MRRNNLPSQRGFTLVEVLTVMLVLVAIASITVESTKDFVFAGRYDVTKDRYEKIKKAIIGDPNQVINGQPNIEGFVKDNGKLPTDLNELTTPKNYLSSSDGLNDGWGNRFILDPVSNSIKSLGKDNLSGGTGYDADVSTSIRPTDWQVNVNGIQASIMASGISGNCPETPLPTTSLDCSAASGTWYTSPSPPIDPVICTKASGTWITSQPTDQATCTLATGTWHTEQPTDKETCDSVHGNWNTSQPTDDASCRAMGGTWDTSQPTDEASCIANSGTWDNTATPPSCSGATVIPSCLGAVIPSCLGAVIPSCSGATVPLCLNATVPFCLNSTLPASKLGCDSVGKSFSYTPTAICMKITDNRPSTPLIINSFPMPIPEDGREHLISFNFPVTPQYVPLGSVLIGVYQYVGSSCSTTRYGRTSTDIQINLFPHTTLPTINW